MNQLEAGGMQAAHSHNSVAVSLAIEGSRCYSMVDGVRKDWAPYVTMVTPPTSVHSHHNEGKGLANWLIVQDGGLYYHCRTMGFRFEEAGANG
jgi:gentisate 1,2-dioxygenase